MTPDQPEELPAPSTSPETGPEYSSHATQLSASSPQPQRAENLQLALEKAFESVIQYKSVAFICFDDLTALELAAAFVAHPLIIKPTLACVNVAQRAIARDLGVAIDTYGQRITVENATLLAGYIKPMLPSLISVPALIELDRYAWVDKEIRASKGNWERKIVDSLTAASNLPFKKLKFEVLHGESGKAEIFELDAAYRDGASIEVAIDIKRIESPKDIHKRSDEIVNKAEKYKKVHPSGLFFAVIYYPFPTQHGNVRSRMESARIDGVFFAGESESSIEMAIELLAGKISDLRRAPKAAGT